MPPLYVEPASEAIHEATSTRHNRGSRVTEAKNVLGGRSLWLCWLVVLASSLRGYLLACLPTCQLMTQPVSGSIYHIVTPQLNVLLACPWLS